MDCAQVKPWAGKPICRYYSPSDSPRQRLQNNRHTDIIRQRTEVRNISQVVVLFLGRERPGELVEILTPRSSPPVATGCDNGLPAHAAEAAQLPLQSRDAAERRDTQPSRRAHVAHDQHVGGSGDPQGKADDDEEDVDHDNGDDGHPNAQGGEHWSLAPPTFLPLLLSLWLSCSLSHVVLGLCCARLKGWPCIVAVTTCVDEEGAD